MGHPPFERIGVKNVVLAFALAPALAGFALHARASDAISEDRPTIIVVTGAGGEDEFGKNFSKWSADCEDAARKAGARVVSIGLKPVAGTNDFDLLKQTLAAEPRESTSDLWLILIGHGTFDSKEAKFNLQGPDFSADELAAWLKPFHRPLAIVDCASCSGPFINKLSGPNRVIVTATRSGSEQNYARFGKYFSQALEDKQADLDKDGQISLLEAFLSASYQVAEFYKLEGRLATEHALIDDNGDGLGTPADWFRGIHAVKRANDSAALDGFRAHQFHLIRSDEEKKLSGPTRARRDELELALAKLRDEKRNFSETDYYKKVETLLLELANLYQVK
jgi:hypothetical protein